MKYIAFSLYFEFTFGALILIVIQWQMKSITMIECNNDEQWLSLTMTEKDCLMIKFKHFSNCCNWNHVYFFLFMPTKGRGFIGEGKLFS